MSNPAHVDEGNRSRTATFDALERRLEHFVTALDQREAGLHFLFSSRERDDMIAGLHDTRAVVRRFYNSLERVRQKKKLEDLFCRLLDGRTQMGPGLKEINNVLENRDHPPEDVKGALFFLDVALSMVLDEMVSHGKASFHQQDLRHILSHFSERGPEFLLVIEPLLRIIPDQGRFALEERGRAARTLINNYDIEAIFIYISCHPYLTEKEKDLIFPWVYTFQKIYRRLRDILYNRRQDKEKAARAWFQRGLDELKRGESLPVKDYQIPRFVREYISRFLGGDMEAARRLSRALVLVVNNEDTLRVMHKSLREDVHIKRNPDAVTRLYRNIYATMQEYRAICIHQKASEFAIKDRFATISRERREMEALTGKVPQRAERTPILGNPSRYGLLPETETHLKGGSLHHLFEIWPIPKRSQDIFNAICRLKEQIPQEPDIQLNQLLFQEKVLEFLMRLERLGIGTVRDPRLSILTNAVQLNHFNIIRKGLYLGSTGCWQCPNQMPPSVIYCSNPHSIINCLGHRVRHIFLRVFLGTGEFYESPFIIDSTPRFGSLDEDGLIDGLLIRPGLFLLDIPERIRLQWQTIEEIQMGEALNKTIMSRIAQENMGG
ncbi:MAG: hypothetical protein JRL30_16655 [Deltaproteobacteria bacterium]|nr:hypothetical protein [Deltaproteobacteria bacterium]